MQLMNSPAARAECSAEEWQARVDLAAAHRLSVMHGFNEGIANHLTLVVPGHYDRYYRSACIGPKSRRLPSWKSASMTARSSAATAT